MELSLRLVLVLVGIAIVVAVYLAAAAKRRRDSRVSFDRRFNRMDIPDVILSHEEDDEDEDDEDEPRRTPAELPPEFAPAALAVAGAEDDAAPGAAAAATEPDELPQIRHLDDDDDDVAPARRGSDQLDLFGSRAEGERDSAPRAARAGNTVPDTATPVAPSDAAEPRAAPAGAADNGLITLFVRAPEGRRFGGPELVRALNAVGMRHGEMSIFHHFGSAELHSETPIFSAADMLEPGTFDLARIEAMRTTGLALFMQLPAALDGPVAFELLLGTAQRIAELTGGELFVSPRQALDPAAIAELRARAARFE